MADVEHRNLTGSALHEPKGIEAVPANQVYVSDGGGSGAWQDQFADLNSANLITLNVRFADISTASSVFVPVPLAGTLVGVAVTLQGAITVADAIVTGKIAGVAITGLALTCTQAGSAAGSTFTGIPTALNAVTANQAIELITDGGSTTAIEAVCTLTVDVS